jgi:Flp pilus assembly protein TadB
MSKKGRNKRKRRGLYITSVFCFDVTRDAPLTSARTHHTNLMVKWELTTINTQMHIKLFKKIVSRLKKMKKERERVEEKQSKLKEKKKSQEEKLRLCACHTKKSLRFWMLFFVLLFLILILLLLLVVTPNRIIF